MKRSRKSLDVKTIDSLKSKARPYRVSDGNGLLLDVRPSGAKVWLCRITVNGRRRDMGLGGYPTVSLAQARKAAADAKGQSTTGADPIESRREAKRERREAEQAERDSRERTFGKVATAFIAGQKSGWKNNRTADLWRTSLTNHAFPVLEHLPVAVIDQQAVLAAIRPVWGSRPATARKVLRRIGSVLRYAAANGWRANDNPADARILRHAGLPALPGGRQQPSLPWQHLPAFMKALQLQPGVAALCLRFLILTALRSGSVRGVRWSELSFEGTPTWTVPGERMKVQKSKDIAAHRVPLSSAALGTLLQAYRTVVQPDAPLKALPRLASKMGDALIFPSKTGRSPFSDMALSEVMRRMNENRNDRTPVPWRDPDGRGAVPHGFRATFRTWVDDTRPEDGEAAERALAHEIENRVSSAYRRSDLFDRRVPLMASWADYCAGLQRAEVNDA
jgi:integrase